jgi:Ca2+:H+ antiporter
LGFVSIDGESHWMEGAMLIAVYVILAIAFYFLPG